MTKFKYEHINKGDESLSDGVQYKFKFENGYGASVIKRRGSYGFEKGLWELAVLNNGHLEYGTPITDDVLGSLTIEEVNSTLEQIKAL